MQFMHEQWNSEISFMIKKSFLRKFLRDALRSEWKWRLMDLQKVAERRKSSKIILESLNDAMNINSSLWFANFDNLRTQKESR